MSAAWYRQLSKQQYNRRCLANAAPIMLWKKRGKIFSGGTLGEF
jgi:hypothetical protein